MKPNKALNRLWKVVRKTNNLQVKRSIKKHIHELKRKGKRKKLKLNPGSRRKNSGHSIARNLKNKNYQNCPTPENFSIINNANSVLEFFIDFQSHFGKTKPIRMDFENVQEITVDALMYALAIIKNARAMEKSFYIAVNLPKKNECKQLILESGFTKYMKSREYIELPCNPNLMIISDGQNIDPKQARYYCEFLHDKLNSKKEQTHHLYETIVELMANTSQHAYSNKNEMKIKHWYIFEHYDTDQERVRFAFLDIGEGIPSTMRKKLVEKIEKVLHSIDNQLIESALNGDFRTQSGMKHRGKGLPKLKSLSKKQILKNFKVISQRGYVTDTNSEELDKTLNGTLYSWEIAKD